MATRQVVRIQKMSVRAALNNLLMEVSRCCAAGASVSEAVRCAGHCCAWGSSRSRVEAAACPLLQEPLPPDLAIVPSKVPLPAEPPGKPAELVEDNINKLHTGGLRRTNSRKVDDDQRSTGSASSHLSKCVH